MPPHRARPQSHRLRIGRQSVPGQAYLLTFTTSNRRPVFSVFDAACLASRTLAAASNWPSASLLAWVLMPDHWHGLVQLGDEHLSRCVSRAKSAATRQWHSDHAGAGPLWAPGFHDHGLRREESLLQVARYIVLNPVRAGLARSCSDYPFWDAVWLNGSTVRCVG